MKNLTIGVACVALAAGLSLGGCDKVSTLESALNIGSETQKETLQTDNSLEETVQSTDISTPSETEQVPETPVETSAPTSSIDSDFKAMMDEYEAFFDEYIAFMQNYNNSGNSLDMLGDYASMMTRYAEFAEKIDSVNTDELTNEELAYYTEVTARVTQKLLNASLE